MATVGPFCSPISQHLHSQGGSKLRADYQTLQTRDFTPLEPDVNEYKYYAPGIGVVREEVVGGGEVIDLVSVESP